MEDPYTSIVNTMPKAAIEATEIDYILKVDDIAKIIMKLVGYKNETGGI